MDHLLAFASHEARQDMMNVGGKRPVPSTEKLQGLEAELREDVIEDKTSMQSQGVNQTAGEPHGNQASMLARYAPGDVQMNYAGKKLGDYNTLLQQMRGSVNNATFGMAVSTMDSKRETQKIGSEYMMLSSQFGLNNRSIKPLKRAKKFGKLASQDSFM
jgi:hypothetical protein